MKKLAFLVVCICLALCAFAQTQQGYVKTIGKPGKKGESLSGVTVRVKGKHNAVVSKSNGRFSMKMKGMKNGDAYSLQQVQKNGYELNDPGTIGRQYAFSPTVPLTIVMVSTAELQAEKQRIENKAYAVAEKNYKAKMGLLEKQLNENTITAEEYRAALQELQDSFEKYQSLIESLADHYAHTDYDLLDENEAEINILIENGELVKADSLIHTLFDPIDVLQRNKEALAHLDQTIADAQGLLDQANDDWAAVLKQQEKDAEYLYQLYTIALAQFDNEKAAKYIQTRAELDTTNVEWQNDAGHVMKDYMADYILAMKYYQRSLYQARIQYGEQSEWVATCYNDIARIHFELSQFDKAIDLQYKSRYIRQTLLGDEHIDTGKSYNDIGLSYHALNEFDSAYVYYKKALDVLISHNGIDIPFMSTIYDNLGTLSYDKGDYNEAIEYLNNAIAIDDSYYGEESLDAATHYNNLARIYTEIHQNEKALELFKKSLNIREKVLGLNHPKVATALNNFASLLLSMGNDDEALTYFFKALDIRKTFFGDMNPNTATIYRNLGSIYNHKGNYEQALVYHMKALSILEQEFGSTNQQTVASYNAIGLVYKNMEDYDNAIDFYKKGLNSIVEITGNAEHKYAIIFYHNIGEALYEKGDYTHALGYCIKAKNISESNYGLEFPVNVNIYNTIGLVYFYQNMFPEAIDYFSSALAICKDESLKALLYSHLARAYEKLGNENKAVEFYTNALNQYEKVYGTDHPDTQSVKNELERLSKY